jgi:phosphoribosylanthranilate isomerase
MPKVRVKICCISSIEEAFLAIQHGASALGLVGPMPSGPGIIEDTLIHEIAQKTPPPIATFLLTSETRAENIVAHYERTHTSTIQLVDALDDYAQYQQIRQALPQVKLVQVIHVIDERSVAEALEVSAYVDALLLDSGNPTLQVKELGGTGRVHNWQLSRQIRENIKIPLFLAGGIHPNNVKKAIEEVDPFGIDLCSGVRTNGKLDPTKLSDFFAAISS